MKQIEWIKVIRDMSPRVHCITNYVTAGDVANMVLAIGGSPIMAQGIREVEDVTSICQSLVLNMGTLEEERVEAMILAGKKAVQLGHPVILDPVGVTASAFRRESALRILKAVRPSVIRGNASEIHMLEQVLSGAKTGNLCGVDAVPGRWMDLTAKAAVSLEKRTGAVVVMTGTTDVVVGPERVMKIMNGHPWMGRITGSGCMLDGIIGAFCALCAPVQGRTPAGGGGKEALGRSGDAPGCGGTQAAITEAAAMAVCAHGLCGELAAGKAIRTGGGTGSFRMYLTDYMSMLDDGMLERGKRIEIS